MADLTEQPRDGIEKMPDPADYNAAPRTIPVGPDPDRMRALVEARVRQGDAHRVVICGPLPAEGGAAVLSAATQAAYVTRGWGLFARYRRESGLNLAAEDLDPRDFVNWLFGLKPSLKMTSWRQYLSRGWGLFGRYRREIGLNPAAEDLDPRDFVNWLFGLKPSLKMTSWRQYRSAALIWVQTLPHTWMEEAAALIEADIGVGADEGRAEQFGRRVGLVRQERAKRFDKKDFDEIVQTLSTFSRSAAVPWLKGWLSAGVATGLRPFEWATTDLEVRSDPV